MMWIFWIMLAVAVVFSPLFWLLFVHVFTRNLPAEESAGPELGGRWSSRRAKVKRFWGLVFAGAAVVIIGCGALMSFIIGSVNASADFESDRWAAEYSGYSASIYKASHSGSSASVSCSSLTGCRDFWRIKGGEGQEAVSIEFDFEVEEGKADLALVHPDGAVVRLSKKESPYVFIPQEGTTRLRIIADHGKFRAQLNIPAGHWTE